MVEQAEEIYKPMWHGFDPRDALRE